MHKLPVLIPQKVFFFSPLVFTFDFLFPILQLIIQFDALRAARNSLIDPYNNLRNWDKGDPCTSNWTGDLGYDTVSTDGYWHVQELDFMWNELNGSIPKEIGNISPLKLLLLNGNKLSGSLTDELGYLSHLDRLQLDENEISGPIPKSYANLSKVKHLHFNNNSISGQIPSTLSNLSDLRHLLLDNNNLSGNLPPGLSKLPQLRVLSLRNCTLHGAVPHFSSIPNLYYWDLSRNYLTGDILSKFPVNMTTIDLSDNRLNGTIPGSLSNLPVLQRLSLENNLFTDSVPTNIWQKMSFNASARLTMLGGNPVCINANLPNNFCGSEAEGASKTSMKIDGVKFFTFREKAMATNNFSSLAQVGQGGYGKVYRGILSDNKIVAIKRAEQGSLQGQKEFLTEITLLSRLHHRNLVSLVGYCDEEGEQILVYEFMPNGTLRDWLSANAKEKLSFGMRLNIALGSAKGILYLHTEANPPVFHRDIKASNILLDSRLTAKVADFGLSRLAPVPNDEGNLPNHVTMAHQSGSLFSIIDSRMGSYPSQCVERFVSLALGCCHEKPKNRASMSEVVTELDNKLKMMPENDAIFSESMYPYSATSASSSSFYTSINPNASSSISGSDLMSDVIPTTTPR
ncbi:hypothetical protein GH714_019652 [Hevea brasiliensis]|uniref:non-specific serine/threonine protein kinase n=1 Tax=Hevea brasiliensis TaxID=3981 RepID=A0A6A6LYT3_HEVBR|nr:hypothetical protein GH714_019652 [Hevea brasiliensis]